VVQMDVNFVLFFEPLRRAGHENFRIIDHPADEIRDAS
jgi:hypothetical protein